MTQNNVASAGLNLLADVKIVAFTTFLIGPSATQYLADMGADVIKIEEPSRGPHERRWAGAGTFVKGVSAFFLMSNRNVRSLAVDLKSEAGRKIALAASRQADVVVSNFRPDVMDRLGLDYETLREDNPGLIYARASGYGPSGPYVRLPGQDLLLQATTGLAAMTGRAGAPNAAGAAVVDQHASALLAMGVLGALHHRHSTGEGQLVDVTMVQSALDLQAEAYALHLNGADLRRPTTGLATAYHEAPYGFYEVQDGYIALSMSPVSVLSAALDDPVELEPWLEPQAAFTHRDEIYEAIAPLLKDRWRDELVEDLRSKGVWCAPVQDYAEALADPIVSSLDPVTEFEHPEAGAVRVVGHPIRFGSGECQVTRTPPALGQHSREVLTQLGYDPSRIEELAHEGVVRV